jgi:hypothetical protein
LLRANIPSSDKTSISQQTPTSIQTAISGQTPSGSEGGDYVLRRTAPGETTAESKEGATSNPPITIALSDGTQVDLPATTKPVTVKLSRESNTVQLNKPGLETSGSMRTLEFDASQVDAAFIPMVTIPAKELGELDPATVNIARVGDIQDNGETLKDQVIYLPFTKDSAGNIVVVDTAASSPAKAAASSGFSTGGRLAMPPAQAGGRTTVKYVVMTFQGHLEWQIAPRLVRMIPDASTLEFRRPADPIKDKEFLIVNGYFSNSCTKEGRFDFQWEIKDLPRLEGIFAYDRDAK